ncbi:MAG: STAS domain-containing protein [Desulfobacterium sp.]|jgi:anti-sigma B factor antagonist|nr:STAS domain-containing protein [Desulfobacterium sp.]
MEIICERQNNIEIFKVKGQLESNTSPELEEQLMMSLERGTTRMVIDFENLEYISSAGIRVILKAVKKLEQSRGRLVLCCLQDYVQEVFEIAGFDTYLTIEPTLERAIASWEEGREKEENSDLPKASNPISPHSNEPLFTKGTEEKGD